MIITLTFGNYVLSRILTWHDNCIAQETFKNFHDRLTHTQTIVSFTVMVNERINHVCSLSSLARARRRARPHSRHALRRSLKGGIMTDRLNAQDTIQIDTAVAHLRYVYCENAARLKGLAPDWILARLTDADRASVLAYDYANFPDYFK